MENRPSFEEIKSFEEFSQYYWYREELKKICRSLGIDASGMKTELNHNIKEYFKGNIIRPKGTCCHTKTEKKTLTSTSPTLLTLQTSILECKFCFSQRFRDFFSKETGIKNFKFNADMVATARKVKETKDASFTLGDLLDIYYGKKTYAKYNKVSLQWNKFVQDFCADPANANIPNKLKAAAKLWEIVRESTREKVYSHDLLNELNIL